MYLLSGQGGEWDSQHLIREYNRNINSLYKSWTPTESNATGLFLEPYNAGFSYQGTGDFRDYKWDTYSLDFDGVDESMTVGDVLSQSAGTISLWVNAQNWDNYDNPFDTSSAVINAGIRVDCHGGGAPTARVIYADDGVGGTMSASLDASAFDDQWGHMVITWSGSTIKGYTNGVESFSKTDLYTSFVADSLIIGAGFWWDSTYRFFEGLIDETAVWDSALSAVQIRAIYNGGTPESLTPYSPLAWWRMGDFVGGVGKLVTDVAATDSNALFLPAVAGNYASVPDAADLDGFGDFTLEATDVTMSDWTPSAFGIIISKYNISGSQRAWSLGIRTDGKLQLTVSLDGGASATSYASSVVTGITDGTAASIRALRISSTVRFYVNGVKLGDDVVASSTQLPNSSAPVEIGTANAGGSNPFLGSLTRARVWNTSTPDSSTPVLDANFTLADKGVSSFTSTSGQTVTIHTTAIDDPAVIRATTDGVLVNDPTFSTDTPLSNKWDVYSVLFDGVDEYISIADNANLDFGATDDFSISAWVKLGSDTADVDGLVMKYAGEPRGWAGWQLRKEANETIMFTIRDGSDQPSVSSAVLNIGQWYHIVGVRDAQSTLYLYVDGVATNASDSTTASLENSGDVWIGRNTYADTIYYDGNIDEVAIFDSALSAAQILAIYNGGTPQSLASYSPVAWWRMGDGDYYDILKDSSGNDHDGTMKNMESTNIKTDTP